MRLRSRVNILGVCVTAFLASCQLSSPPLQSQKVMAAAQLPGKWETVVARGAPVAREEAGFLEAGGKLYLVGGRHDLPVDIYDPNTASWSKGAVPPIEIHHFQPVEFDGKIYVVQAMTGPYPRETPLPYVLIYDPAKDQWTKGPEIPAERRRGGSGVVVHHGKIYTVAGIVDGHWAGYTPWFDEFDPRTGRWTKLPDAPHPRDHFQAAIIDDKIYAVGGRTSSGATNQVFDLTVAPVDVFDFTSGKWSVLPRDLPVPRAGAMTAAVGYRLIIIGGESMAHLVAHSEVDAYNTLTGRWEQLPPLAQGRHGTGAAVQGGRIYVAAGAGNRGGNPVLATIESAPLIAP
jgi:N-acetylneuraminic acid mutarotase